MIDLQAVCNPEQLQAFIDFERVILEHADVLIERFLGSIKLFGFNVAEYAKNSKNKFIEKHVDKLEQTLFPVMTESGLINGIAVNAVLKSKNPNLYYLINIPQENFNLAEFTEKIVRAI